MNKPQSMLMALSRFQHDRTTQVVRPTKLWTDWTPPQRRYGTLPKTLHLVRVPEILRKHRSLIGRDKLRKFENGMATKKHGVIIETPTEARQTEPGPSVLALLTISTGLAILMLGVVWFVLFR